MQHVILQRNSAQAIKKIDIEIFQLKRRSEALRATLSSGVTQ